MTERGLKPKDLEKMSGVSANTIRSISKQAYLGITYYNARCICKALGIKMEELYDEK